VNRLSRWVVVVAALALLMVGAVITLRLIDPDNSEPTPPAKVSTPTPTASVIRPDGLTATATPFPMEFNPTPEATSQPPPSPTASPSPSPSATPIAPLTLAPRVVLGPFVHDWQTWNNCGPATLSIGLSYFEIARTQSAIGGVVHPDSADKNVSIHELLSYAESVGVRSREMINGDLDTLRRLISVGVPVLTEGLLRSEDDVGHYRIVRGYDLDADLILTSDSYIGAEVWMTSDDFQTLWMPFFFAYAPLYLPENEHEAANAVGAAWDRPTMLGKALVAARFATVGNPTTALLWYNLGDALFLNDEYASALDAYERSMELGLTDRFFWYRFNYLILLNSLGMHSRLLELTDPIVADVDSLTEVQVERGAAFHALGQTDEAIRAYEKALEHAPQREDIRLVIDDLKP